MCGGPKALLAWPWVGNRMKKDRWDGPDNGGKTITKDALRLGVHNGKELAQDKDVWRQVVVATMDLKWTIKAKNFVKLLILKIRNKISLASDSISTLQIQI